MQPTKLCKVNARFAGRDVVVGAHEPERREEERDDYEKDEHKDPSKLQDVSDDHELEPN